MKLKPTDIRRNIMGCSIFAITKITKKPVQKLYTLSKYLALVFILILITPDTQAQCQVQYNGILCVGNPIVFTHNASGAKSFSWNFNGEGTSVQGNPAFTFTTSGTKKVTLKVILANGQTCNSSVTFFVNPKPADKLRLINEQVQCVGNNQFCFTDSSQSPPNNCFRQIKYLFDDGELMVINNPIMPYTFCKSYTGSGAGIYGLTVEIEDCNGCINKYRSKINVILTDSGIATFNITDDIGCDSLSTSFNNTSPIPFSDVKSFYWNFGDGTIDSSHWGYPNGVPHKYLNPGIYDITLWVKTKNGCTQRYVKYAGVRVGKLEPRLISYKDSACISDDDFKFTLSGNNLNSITTVIWNFGDPGSGDNIIKNLYDVEHSFSSLGPFRITVSIIDQNCPDTVLSDTVTIIGPLSRIEKPVVNLIAEHEKYQCVSRDTVHFPNTSLFYHNDRVMRNDDSNTVVNGGFRHYFDGNKTSMNARPQIRGNDHVIRLWCFDDSYAERCTTDTKNGINVNRNCNYSRDSLPKHYYTPWDSIYYKTYYKQNIPFTYTSFDATTGKCITAQADTTQKALHRKLFYRNIPRCYAPWLYQKDTVHPLQCEHISRTVISIMPPSASRLHIGGAQCLGPSDTFGITFFLDHTKPGCTQNVMAICPDSISNPTQWLSMIQSNLQTGELPGIGKSFPYNQNGTFNNVFSLKYTKENIKDSDGYVTIGLAIGNGTGTNQCHDTVWYHHMTRFPIVHDTITLLKPKNREEICKGDTIIFSMPNNNGNKVEDIAQLKWYSGPFYPVGPDLNISQLYLVTETYLRYQPDKQRPGKLANYLVRRKSWAQNGKEYKVSLDTLKLAEIDSFQATVNTLLMTPYLQGKLFNAGFDPADLTPEQITAMIWNGVGTIGNASSGAKGCIDTTGNIGRITYNYKTIKKRILHFRDTSLLPYDTLQRGAYKQANVYHFIPKYNGQYYVNLILTTTKGCQYDDDYGNYGIVYVGFYTDASLKDSIFCRNKEIRLKPNFRYFKAESYTDLDSNNYWYKRQNEAGRPNREGITRWDWSRADDTAINPQTIFGAHPYGHTGLDNQGVILGGSDPGKIYYKQGGIYRFRITTSDSNQCRDTIEKRVYVNEAKAKFSLDVNYSQCKTIIEFKDSSYYSDYCKKVTGKACNRIKYWRINWGDSTAENSYFTQLPKKIGHDYTRFGKFRIWLWVTTEVDATVPPRLLPNWKNGCTDSTWIDLDIPGPQPRFTPDRYVICKGDSILFSNTTQRATNSARWIWDFGDNNFATDTGKSNMSHTYYIPGKYNVFISQYDSIPGSVKYCSAQYPDIPLDTLITVTVKDYDTSHALADKYFICPYDSIVFTSNSHPDYNRFHWQFGNTADTATTGNTSIVRSFKTSGVYRIILSPIYNSALPKPYCPVNDSIVIVVDSVKADFNIYVRDTPVFCFDNHSRYATSYRWGYYHRGNIVFTGKPFMENMATTDSNDLCNDYTDSMGHYWVCLEATNSNGCKDTVCKDLSWYRLRLILPPNIFTPGTKHTGATDDEGVYTDNDVFNIYIKGQDRYELVIYDRWGLKVFESHDHNYDWNGSVFNNGNECPDGTYYYMLQYRYRGLKKDEPILNGVITLIREK